ncbi:unnamed protein product [Trichobilharzia szidati]|nr:unnamed protein product [Trichobilharzia szidati]
MEVNKTEIINQSIKDDMQQCAVDLTIEAMNKYSSYDEIAGYVAKSMTTKYPGNWHCKVGVSFGSFDACDFEFCLRYFIGNLAIILYKSN